MTKQAVYRNRSAFTGLIIVLIGAFFLLNNLDLIPFSFRETFFNWKGLILLIGLVQIFNPKERWSGVVLLIVGGYFLSADYIEDVWGFELIDWELLWPTLIILGGILFLLTRTRRSSDNTDTSNTWDWGTSKSQKEEVEDYIDVDASFGGSDLLDTSQNFKGGVIRCTMGGGTYDFSQAEISFEGPAVIDLKVIMGGANFIVPADWTVRTELTAIMGGFSDDRKRLDTTPTSPDKVLIIRGTLFMGGGEIKNYV